jgi:2-keto-3-deoxy-L-rhamnonate aldolase RhmA
LQIETQEAIREVEAIAAVPGVDVLFVGPADLSKSLGLATSEPKAELRKAYAQVVKAAQHSGIAAGIDVVSPDYAPIYRDLGFTFMTFGTDYGFMIEGGKGSIANLRAKFRTK